eukprot:8421764-Alexandrium_andersonii.AAC.1
MEPARLAPASRPKGAASSALGACQKGRRRGRIEISQHTPGARRRPKCANRSRTLSERRARQRAPRGA